LLQTLIEKYLQAHFVFSMTSRKRRVFSVVRDAQSAVGNIFLVIGTFIESLLSKVCFIDFFIEIHFYREPKIRKSFFIESKRKPLLGQE